MHKEFDGDCHSNENEIQGCNIPYGLGIDIMF